MKRVNIDLKSIAAYDNLSLAAYKAAKGKRDRTDVLNFFNDFENNINKLHCAIINKQMPYGIFKSFIVRDPKIRKIHAACFEDRIFHHAVMNFAEPVFEKHLIPNTYACRKGKGNFAAINRVQHEIRRFPWYVKVDIKHYFDHIDHAFLLDLLKKQFKNNEFIALLKKIIESFQLEKGKGLPIGSLTSQHFANFYLAGVDRYITEQLPASGYVRYMDDFIWWVSDKNTARQTLKKVKQFVEKNRLLKLKENTQIGKSRQGVNFCGYRILPSVIRLSRRKKKRYIQHRLRRENEYIKGHITANQLQQAYMSVYSMTSNVDAWHWRKKNLCTYPAYDV